MSTSVRAGAASADRSRDESAVGARAAVRQGSVGAQIDRVRLALVEAIRAADGAGRKGQLGVGNEYRAVDVVASGPGRPRGDRRRRDLLGVLARLDGQDD